MVYILQGTLARVGDDSRLKLYPKPKKWPNPDGPRDGGGY